MANELLIAFSLLRHFGLGWILFRLGYTLKQRSGWLQRRTPVSSWIAQPLKDFLIDAEIAAPAAYLRYRHEFSPPFFFSPLQRSEFAAVLTAWDHCGITPVLEAEGIERGELRYFGRTIAHMGYPPQWHTNPFTHHPIASDRHWSRISDFDHGDIKLTWEPSRFSFVYALVRAYWRTGDDRFAELFWQLVEHWRLHNPPQQGPNWKCGQEISFRIMAWCFGLYGFLRSPKTTATRLAALAQMMAVSGKRIEANLSYALSQHNNHGISEALGLWTLGTLFPEFRDARRWKQRSKRILETLGRDLIYDDGAFSQHSVNYHRLMLHDYLWALRLGDLQGDSFSAALKDRIGKAGVFLYQLQDEMSGRLPNYGSNDGALILPLNNCDYQDFRPVIQATHYLVTGTRCYATGPWDEDLLWLFGPDALEAPVAPPIRVDFQASSGGYYTLRSATGFTFTRCATFRHRPGQADQLHADVWWKGHNIAIDAGTYSYNAPDPWARPFSQTAYHNTVTVDQTDQMERVSHFLWLPWVQGWTTRSQTSPDRFMSYWEGEHDAYHRLKSPVYYRRGILRLGDDHWLVFDRLLSSAEHHYCLHWLLSALPYTWDEASARMTLVTPAGTYHVQMASTKRTGTYSLMQSDINSPKGWYAPSYYSREAALSVTLSEHAQDLLFWTLFSPEIGQATIEDSAFQLEMDSFQARINLGVEHSDFLIASASLEGTLHSALMLS